MNVSIIDIMISSLSGAFQAAIDFDGPASQNEEKKRGRTDL
jgi:hypothetical protein